MGNQQVLENARQVGQILTQSLLSEDEVLEIYQRLANLQVDLDDDPLAYGPKRMQGKVADCRKALEICENIFLAVSQKMHVAKRALRAKKAGLDLSMKMLFSTDPEVKYAKSVKDREALAAVKLQEEWVDTQKLEQQVEDLDAVLLVIKTKRSDLKDTQGRLRDQLQLCQVEVGLGSRWGEFSAKKSVPLEPKQVYADHTDTVSVEQLLQGMEVELAAPTQVQTLSVAEGKSDSDYTEFLDSIPDVKQNQKQVVDDIDIMSLLEED